MRKDALPLLWVRGAAAALSAWKALLVALAVNAALALLLAAPIESGLHVLLDRSPSADALAAGFDPATASEAQRSSPGLLGRPGPLVALLEGRLAPHLLLGTPGPLGTLALLGLLNAALSALFAGGLAGRFAADRERGSLSAFAGDCARLGPGSVVLGALGLATLLAAYAVLVPGLSALVQVPDRRYEWVGIGASAAGVLAFLLVGSAVRATVASSRGALGLGRGNPFVALATGAGFVLGRPVKAMLLEVSFGVAGLLPLVPWLVWAPVWDGTNQRSRLLLVAGQQAVVLWRIAARAGHLGAATAWMKGARETARPAPAKLEPAEG